MFPNGLTLAADFTDYGTVGLGLLVFFVFFIIIFLASRYKRCPSNKILCVYGKVGAGRSVNCFHGGGTLVWPLIQDYQFLDLTPMTISIPLKNALSLQNIRVNVPSTFTIAIGTSGDQMHQAAVRLLDLGNREIETMASEIIFGQLRLTVASLTIEQINQDREKFLEAIRNNVEPELSKVGLLLVNVNITDITDESGYIEAIGQKAAATAIQQARGDVADQVKLGEVRVSGAQKEKDVQVAELNKLRAIGTRAAQREQAVKIADLEKEQKIGEASAGFLRDSQIKEAERQMRISVADANAKAVVGEQQAGYLKDAQVKQAEQQMRVSVADANAKAISGENTAQAVVAASQAALQVKQAEAYQLGETRKREAEAGVLEAQNRAMTKAALAQAERVEAERRAALEAPAKAEKAKMIVDAEAVAEQNRIHALGQAAAIFAKLDAEARGNYEVLAKKAEGLKRIVEATGGSEQAFKLLMLEHLDHLAETSAHAISNIKFDKVVVWDGGKSGDGKGGATSGFLQNLAYTLPPMLQVMKDVGGVQFPESIAKLTDGAEAKKDKPEAAEPAKPPAPKKEEPPAKPKA
jgi:flotillin